MSKDINDLVPDIKNFEKKLQKTFDKNVKKVYTKISYSLEESIKNRWEKGVGVDETGGKTKKLKSLSKNTVKIREEKDKKGELDSRTKPQTSNLIMSGKTIDSIQADISNTELLIGSSDRTQIIADNEQRGRSILFLSDKEVEIVDEIIEKELDKLFDE